MVERVFIQPPVIQATYTQVYVCMPYYNVKIICCIIVCDKALRCYSLSRPVDGE